MVLAEEFIFEPVLTPNLPARKLTVRRSGADALITWSGAGILQSAANLTGGWSNASMRSPFRVKAESSRFYRLISASRPVSVYIPATYKVEVPMAFIISLHGFTLDAAFQENLISLRPLAESVGFLYVLPEGSRDSSGNRFWNATDACCAQAGSKIDDVAYLKAIIEGVSASFNVDRKRVYVVGHSNGGFMAYRMACDQADLIAGIASLAGATWSDSGRCKPSSLVNVLQIHGSADSVISYNGGNIGSAKYPGAVATIEQWGTYDGCQSTQADPTKTLDLDLDVAGLDSRVTRTSDCSAGAVVELWTIQGGSHAPLAKRGNSQSELPVKLVEWFLAHPKPE